MKTFKEIIAIVIFSTFIGVVAGATLAVLTPPAPTHTPTKDVFVLVGACDGDEPHNYDADANEARWQATWGAMSDAERLAGAVVEQY